MSGQTRRQWVLVNASPDIRAQLQATPDMQPNRALRDSALAAIMLVDGQVDHTTGLYMLREATRPWPALVHATARYADLTHGNPVLGVLGHFCGVDRRRIDLDREFTHRCGARSCGGAHCPWRASPRPIRRTANRPLPGDNIALVIPMKPRAAASCYAPGLAAIDERLWQAMQGGRMRARRRHILARR